jgi:hypothetical protein
MDRRILLPVACGQLQPKTPTAEATALRSRFRSHLHLQRARVRLSRALFPFAGTIDDCPDRYLLLPVGCFAYVGRDFAPLAQDASGLDQILYAVALSPWMSFHIAVCVVEPPVPCESSLFSGRAAGLLAISTPLSGSEEDVRFCTKRTLHPLACTSALSSKANIPDPTPRSAHDPKPVSASTFASETRANPGGNSAGRIGTWMPTRATKSGSAEV